mmetsp:Transcript_12053/g.18018  ORF Transcript_12053/g.18018 Transcript_12053/m.18018 type:complete len:160 (+) Transcript_12053:55-534(+)
MPPRPIGRGAGPRRAPGYARPGPGFAPRPFFRPFGFWGRPGPGPGVRGPRRFGCLIFLLLIPLIILISVGLGVIDNQCYGNYCRLYMGIYAIILIFLFFGIASILIRQCAEPPESDRAPFIQTESPSTQQPIVAEAVYAENSYEPPSATNPSYKEGQYV